MDHAKLAADILSQIGGKDNVKSVTHCISRLRFYVKEDSKVDRPALGKISGVLKVLDQGGQLQVVIGNEVTGVYKEVVKLVGPQEDAGKSAPSGDAPKQKITFSSAMGQVAAIFTPILPVLTASGMISAILVLLSALKVLDSSNETYVVFSKIANAGFYFLPVMIAYTTAAKLNCNKFLAVMLAGVLLHPDIMQQGLHIFGIQIQSVSYGSTVVPAILTVILMYFVEKLAEKISPSALKFFLVPLLTVLITAPISLLVLGPLGFNIGQLLAKFITFLSSTFGPLATGLIGAIYPLMVMTGMHHAYGPVAMATLTSVGYESFMAPGGLCANVAQSGAAFAVFLRTKDKDVKAVAGPGSFSCLLGVSEPVMYGVTLQYKTALVSTMIGGGCGGLLAGLLGVRAIALASPGLAALPIFLGETFLFAILAIAAAFAVGFAVSFVTFKEKEA